MPVPTGVPPVRLAAAAALAEAVAALHRAGSVHGGIRHGQAPWGVPPRYDGAAPVPPLPCGADLAAVDCAAPEVIRGRRPTRASDVYALAVAVADQLAAETPAASASLAEALHRGLCRPPLVVGPAVPPRVARLLRRAVSPRPWRRPSAAALAGALRAAHEAAVAPRPVPVAPRPAPVAPRPPLLARPPPAAPRPDDAGALLPVRPRGARRAATALLAFIGATAALGLAVVYRAGRVEREVEARLEAGDVAGARRSVRYAEQRGTRGPVLEKLRGDIACAAHAYGECLARYHRAVAGRPSLGRARRLHDNALALAARGEERRAVVALLARLGDEDELAQMTRSPRYWTRWNAVSALEARGALKRVELGRVYALDLLYAGSCETRRAAVAKLAALHDPRLIPELTRAREAARASWSEWRCTGAAVDEALRASRPRLAAR